MKGANVGCCVIEKQCRRSFHFSCGIKNNCLSQFGGDFLSFCHDHVNQEPINSLEPSQTCEICKGQLEKHAASTARPMCCESDKYFHVQCLREQACALKDNFCCPLCENFDSFRECMLLNGVYIPQSESVIAQYRSGDESDDEDNSQPVPKRKRTHKQWVYEKSFATKAIADKFLEEEHFAYYYRNKSESGMRITYRCKLMKFRGRQCEAAIYLLFDSNTTDIQLFRSQTEHTHENDLNAVEVIPVEIQNKIRELYQNNVTKPQIIINTLIAKGMQPPSKAKFQTFFKKLKEEKYGAEKMDCGKLERWLQENSQLPESETQPFIVSYEMNYDGDTDDFRFFVSSKALLKLAMKSDEKLHTDGTYKLIWNEFPILIVGTTDLNRSFHPFGMAVCTSEKQHDFAFIFTSLKLGVSKISNVEYKPRVLIADGASAIGNAGREVFGDSLAVVMCWFHMRKNVKDHVKVHIKNETTQHEFLHDLDVLQVSKTQKIFDAALGLFMHKWREVSPELMNYFEKEWIQKNPNWYECYQEDTPANNCAMETFNRIVKDDHTLRERLEVGKFRVVLFNMIETWSITYDIGRKMINSTSPELDLPMWTEAYQWAKQPIKITSRRSENKIIYRCSASAVARIQPETNWRSFDEFREKSFSYYDTTFIHPISRDNWLQGTCDCRDYFKHYICKHVIGISLRLKCISPPPEAKTVPIGSKRKRGRPAKAKNALTRQ